MNKGFCHTHVHTSYSLLDGASKLDELVAKAAADGQPGIATTDHGNLYSWIPFYKECKKHDINPILGIEAYFCDDQKQKGVKAGKGSLDGSDKRYYHLSLMAEDNVGYRNLIAISSQAFLEGYYFKPRTDWSMLEAHHEGIVATTGCLGGVVLQHLLHDDYDGALAATSRLRDIFGPNNLYVELQNHGLSEQRKTNPWLIDIAKRLDLKLICTNDTHYTNHEDASSHEILLCCQTGAKLSDPNRFQFESDQHYLKTSDEMRSLFSEVPESCDNTLEINERCNVQIDFDTLHLPKFPIPDGYETASAYLSKLAFDGLLVKGLTSQKAFERLGYELSVIDAMGVSSYFLIVWDICKFADTQGIRRGPGRGSSAGSMVSYCLGITKIDPLKYDLSFERFLNPSRITLPDVDLDTQTERREEIINYTKKTYGDDRVAQVITFSEIRARAAVRDATRVLGLPPQVGDRISKAMPELHMGEPTPIKYCLEPSDRYAFGYAGSEKLREMYQSDREVKQVIDAARGLEGLVRQDGIGAAAVVITPEPLTDLVPIQKKPKGPVVTQWDKNTIEELGLLKMDFLGLRNLDIIKNALDMIDEPLDIDNLPLDDYDTYELYRKGETTSVFQCSESGMKSLLKRIKPTNINDIAAALALYRPGPMASNMHNDYADRKNGVQPVTYFHPDAEDVLASTYGLMPFQESIMKISQRFAGYSGADADTLRRNVGKKKIDAMIAERDKFVSGCMSNGYDEEFANKLFTMIEAFASYGFVRAHAFGYAFVSYQTAYLKAHYPAEYMAAVCASVSDTIEKSSMYLYEAKRMGINIAPPDINRSEKNFTAKGGEILVGLASIRHVGTVTDTLLEERAKAPFDSLIDFLKRVRPNLREFKSLAQAGALDQFGSRWGIVSVADELVNQAKKDRGRQSESLFDVDTYTEIEIPTQEYPLFAKMALEKEVVGIYISGHPLSESEPLEHMVGDLLDVVDDKWVDVLVVVSDVNEKVTKAGARMAVLTVEDQTGSMEVVVFPKTFSEIGTPQVGDIVEIGVRIGRDRDEQRNYVLNKWSRRTSGVIKDTEQDTMKIFLPRGFAQDEVYISKLKGILLSHHGTTPMSIWISRSTTLQLTEQFSVDVSNEFLDDVKELFLSFGGR